MPGASASQWTDGSDEPNAAEDHQSWGGEGKGAWPEEFPNVLWAYRTTARTPTGETPFRLTYGTDALIPIKVVVTNMRREAFNEDSNGDLLRVNLDCLDEVRDEASQKMTRYQ